MRPQPEPCGEELPYGTSARALLNRARRADRSSSSSSDGDANVPWTGCVVPISADDWFLKSNEFRVWLRCVSIPLGYHLLACTPVGGSCTLLVRVEHVARAVAVPFCCCPRSRTGGSSAVLNSTASSLHAAPGRRRTPTCSGWKLSWARKFSRYAHLAAPHQGGSPVRSAMPYCY